MGVNPTPSNYKTFTFDNTNSAQYGVYITGKAVFNAPQRNVEMVTIPGRNGAYALDHGNFNNIEVTYPAGIVADTEADFAQAVSNLRNFLCSKEGYCRLTDDYNSGEYRMAIYKSGLEVDHEGLLTGEFDIVFECKPQRWLTSGETATAVTSGGTLSNPTLFDARPLLDITGYGDIDFGGDTIKVLPNTTVGLITVANPSRENNSFTATTVFDDTYLQVGDTFYCVDYDDNNYGGAYNGYWRVDSGTVTSASASFSGINGTFRSSVTTNTLHVIVLYGLDAVTFSYGTSATKTTTGTISVVTSAYGTVSGTIKLVMAYDGVHTITLTVTETLPSHFSKGAEGYSTVIYYVDAISTYPTSTGTIYIDLDIGEAYKIENVSVISVNNAVSIPAELPTLPSGSTTITYDNTITQLKITPRWWKV